MCQCVVLWVRCAVVKKISSPLQLPNGTASSEMMIFHPDTIAPQQPQTEKFGFCLQCISTNYHLRRSTVWTDNNIHSQVGECDCNHIFHSVWFVYTYIREWFTSLEICLQMKNWILLPVSICIVTFSTIHIVISTLLKHPIEKTVRCSFYKDLQLHTPHTKCYRFTYVCCIFCVI